MKTYDPEIDGLIERLLEEDTVIAARAAQMIFELYNRLEMYEAEHYNQQIGGEL
jgi:hypothetical protein